MLNKSLEKIFELVFNPYTENLPETVIESMRELEVHSDIYLEKLNDILGKNKKDKINPKKIKEVCAIYNKRMIAKGNMDLIKSTNRDYKKDSTYIKNSKNFTNLSLMMFSSSTYKTKYENKVSPIQGNKTKLTMKLITPKIIRKT